MHYPKILGMTIWMCKMIMHFMCQNASSKTYGVYMISVEGTSIVGDVNKS